MPAKKLVLLSRVVVRAGRQIHDRCRGAEIVGQCHDRAAVEHAWDRFHLVAHLEFAFDAILREMGDLHADVFGKGNFGQIGDFSHGGILVR
jgi:hypothetical protein